MLQIFMKDNENEIDLNKIKDSRDFTCNGIEYIE